MARYNQKRKRSSGRPYGAKKRKTTFKRKRGSKSLADYTSLNTKGTSVGFRGRKTSRRQYKKWLWDSTLFKTHYRSLGAATATINTPANNTDMTLGGVDLYRFGLGNKFWTAGGGAITNDTGVALPLFIGDIILRGGVWAVTFHNPASTDVMVTVWEVFTIADPGLSVFPVLSVKGWDPSVSSDFSTLIGKSGRNRQVTIEGGNSYTITGRFKVQKIDQAVYELEGKSPWLFYSIANVGTAAAVGLNLVRTYNLSFSADAIGTT